MQKESLQKIQKEYKEEIEYCKSCIITRIENASLDEETKIINQKDPFKLEIILNDSENQIDHSYDLGRMEALLRSLSDIEYLLAYEK
jgi:hypothetical protein